MKNLSKFQSSLDFLLTDIDDTLTDEGLLGSQAYEALWALHRSGIKVIPVTGRPAGWCEMIARVWPVAAVVGENGGFYFRYHNKKMIRNFFFDSKTQNENRKKLELLQTQILNQVSGAAVASDQFCRMMDLAIDFCEDVPRLSEQKVNEIVGIFEKAGAQAKVSSIHVNGWFGEYNKVTQSLKLLQQEFSVPKDLALKTAGFVGDSPNDEPMFEVFPHSFAVSNITPFLDRLQCKPQYLSQSRAGLGFVEVAKQILSARKA
jgi:hypothetical protein